MAILEKVVAIPHDLAILCVTPLRIFAFFCFTGERKTNVMLKAKNCAYVGFFILFAQ